MTANKPMENNKKTLLEDIGKTEMSNIAGPNNNNTGGVYQGLKIRTTNIPKNVGKSTARRRKRHDARRKHKTK